MWPIGDPWQRPLADPGAMATAPTGPRRPPELLMEAVTVVIWYTVYLIHRGLPRIASKSLSQRYSHRAAGPSRECER